MKYKIHELSARSVMRRAAVNNDGGYSYALGEDATLRCVSFSAPEVQDDCALFFQIMSALHGDGFTVPSDVEVVTDLADIIFYMDFSGIFDRNGDRKKYSDLHKQAEAMFRPEGIALDFGMGMRRYLAFERSGSMSRNSRLSFIREDFYEPVRRRVMLDMTLGICELSKLYAYNGLMLTSGFRIEDMSIWDDRRVVVVDNPVTPVYEADIVTVEDDGSGGDVRKYNHVEKTDTIEVTEFDGEGLISKELAELIDNEYCGRHIHTSFQIRMPYIKGVVHEVDFKSLFAELDVPCVIDVWGHRQDIRDVDLILTKSMFKGFGWMTENGLSFSEYLSRCSKYRHALYISGVSKVNPAQFTELNYQFLNTAAMTAEEFRPPDLPAGWQRSPEKEKRHWITKYTEIVYYRFVADAEYRKIYFLSALTRVDAGSQDIALAKILHKNPLFINEHIYASELEGRARSVLKDYAIGRLLVPGDNRYLSGDLMRFLEMLVKTLADAEDSHMGTMMCLLNECYRDATAYVPCAEFEPCESYTLLRNPHIARNEEAIVKPPEYIGPLRQRYLSHLNYVIMVDSRTLIPERLGGADFDGDMIKIIADPLLNRCVARNYTDRDYDLYGYRNSIPLLKIPSAEPVMRDANDWRARFETVKSTFSTRIGQICNAAFDRSIVAYDENSSAAERERLQAETEMLEILTGLEIDSVKTGIKPDLTEYLSRKTVSRSPFLKYKNLVNDSGEREWYEPTQKQRLDRYFASVDWDNVSSNVERLPYLAKLLEEKTPKIAVTPAKDSELFAFARKKDWAQRLDSEDMEYMRQLIADYERALDRIRKSRHIPERGMSRRSDIERILFSRGQENDFTAEELYSLFNDFNAARIAEWRAVLTDERWHLMTPPERESFLKWFLPHDTPERYHELFADFRFGGYRVLGDVLCDLDDMYTAEQAKQHGLHRQSDSEQLRGMLRSYMLEPKFGDYKAAIVKYCRIGINFSVGADTALKCAVALGKRAFAFDVLLDRIEPNAIKRRLDYVK